MEGLVEKMHALLFSTLVISSPMLSGNMKAHIKVEVSNGSERSIIIDAPFYDLKRWRADKTVVHTGAVIEGRTAYAEWVNRLGAFNRHNKSEGWVDRAILEAAYAIAGEIGAEVIYEL